MMLRWKLKLGGGTTTFNGLLSVRKYDKKGLVK